MTISRRTFLLRSAEVALGATAASLVGIKLSRHPAQPWNARAFAPLSAKRSTVAVIRATQYDEAQLEQLVHDGLASIGAELDGRTVLLKPNLVEYDNATVINTDPRLIAATVLAVRRMGAAAVTVGEGPGHRRDTDYVVSASGLWDALRAVEAPFVDLNTAPLAPVQLLSSYTDLRSLWLPEAVTKADVVISMPKMKTHHWGGVTLSLKNCFGCVPGRVYGWPKNVLHWAGLEASIIDVAAAVLPDYQIIDGIVGMEGNGPIQGSPKAAGVLVFGNDPVAADTVGARLMGLEPRRIGYLSEASRFLGNGQLDEIVHAGEDVERAATSFALLPQFEHLRIAGSSGGAGTAGGATMAAQA